MWKRESEKTKKETVEPLKTGILLWPIISDWKGTNAIARLFCFFVRFFLYTYYIYFCVMVCTNQVSNPSNQECVKYILHVRRRKWENWKWRSRRKKIVRRRRKKTLFKGKKKRMSNIWSKGKGKLDSRWIWRVTKNMLQLCITPSQLLWDKYRTHFFHSRQKNFFCSPTTPENYIYVIFCSANFARLRYYSFLGFLYQFYFWGKRVRKSWVSLTSSPFVICTEKHIWGREKN